MARSPERLAQLFKKLKREARAGFAAFMTAGDPSQEISADIIRALPAAGVDLLELGMPFSDPMAEGAAIQASSQRALEAGGSMDRTFALLKDFRKTDAATPVILMGYYNPVLSYGLEAFAQTAAAAGADGLIIVDLPPEEDQELRTYSQSAGIAVIRLIAPTSSASRMGVLLAAASSFLYYVSITGTTGAARPDFNMVDKALKKIRRQTDLPIALGFGIKTPEDAREAAKIADLVVVGSSLVEKVGTHQSQNIVKAVRDHAAELSAAICSVKGG